jgi:hypothetical protein
MTAANPIMDRVPSGGGRVNEAAIAAYAAELNGKRFIQDQGWEYFVGSGPDGSKRLERRDRTR